MTSAMAEDKEASDVKPPPRKPLRFRIGMWIAVALVFAAEVGVAFWLGNPPPGRSSRPAASMIVHMSGDSSQELLALQDPTLFLLPHRDNFSGAAWIKIPKQRFEPPTWTEAAMPLPLAPKQLGATFLTFMGTNPPPPFHAEMLANSMDITTPPPPTISTPSRIRMEGDLAKLRLATPVHLPPQTNADVLPNTAVQMMVDSQGRVLSPVVVTSCLNPDTDKTALDFARNARFEPIKAAAIGSVIPDKITFGTMVFEWQTVPPAATNAPATPF